MTKIRINRKLTSRDLIGRIKSGFEVSINNRGSGKNLVFREMKPFVLGKSNGRVKLKKQGRRLR